jgi:hypothetical protein
VWGAQGRRQPRQRSTNHINSNLNFPPVDKSLQVRHVCFPLRQRKFACAEEFLELHHRISSAQQRFGSIVFLSWTLRGYRITAWTTSRGWVASTHELLVQTSCLGALVTRSHCMHRVYYCYTAPCRIYENKQVSCPPPLFFGRARLHP